MVAYTFRMPSGIPGTVHRVEHLTTEAQYSDPAAPFAAYGVGCKIGANGKLQPIGAGDAPAAFYGILVRPYPTQTASMTLGSSIPPTDGRAFDVARRGYVMVAVGTGSVPTKRGAVYVRIAAGGVGKPVGGFEAAADGANTILVPNAEFMGPADASGNCEIAYNI